MASRALHIYDLAALAADSAAAAASSVEPRLLQTEPWQRRESALKFMARAVACMPNDAGYASSSIEGRVAVEWFDPSASSQARKYAFKCHRQASPEGIDVVYPVNALAFHPVHGTFASGGGDGFVAMWDGVGKRRIRQYQKYMASVAALSFSRDGRLLAVGISPGFEDGKDTIGDGVVKVYIRELGENEAKAKGAK
jgi:cell cycle arrest protein BUB3